MKFIVLLISWLIKRYVPHKISTQHFNSGLLRYLSLFANQRTYLSRGALGVCCVVLPNVLLVWLLSFWIHYFFALGGSTLWSVLVLFYCIGPDNPYRLMRDYFSAAEQDDEAGKQQATSKLMSSCLLNDDMQPAKNPNNHDSANPSANNSSDSADRTISQAMFATFHESLFAVIFWFMLFGPAGAILYRLSNECHKLAQSGHRVCRNFARQVRFMQGCLDWLPIRLSVLLYALAGHFKLNHAPCMLRQFSRGISSNARLLIEGGIAAMPVVGIQKPGNTDNIQENKNTLALIERAWLLALVLIAVFVLGAWF